MFPPLFLNIPELENVLRIGTMADATFEAKVAEQIEQSRAYGFPGIGAPYRYLQNAVTALGGLLHSGEFDNYTAPPEASRLQLIEALVRIAYIAQRFATDGSTSYPGFTPISAADNPEPDNMVGMSRGMAAVAGHYARLGELQRAGLPTYDHLAADFSFDVCGPQEPTAKQFVHDEYVTEMPQAGCVTGRFQSDKPNIEEVPKEAVNAGIREPESMERVDSYMMSVARDCVGRVDAAIAELKLATYCVKDVQVTTGCPEGYVRDPSEPELCMRKEDAEPIKGWAAIILEPATNREGPSHYICPTIWPDRYEAVKAYGDKKIVAFVPLNTFVGDK